MEGPTSRDLSWNSRSNGGEKSCLVCFFAAAILLLVNTAAAALWWVIRRLMGLQAWWMAKWMVPPVTLAYFAAYRPI